MKHIGVIVNIKKPLALSELTLLTQYLETRAMKLVIPEELKHYVPAPDKIVPLPQLHEHCDLIVVMGGDGTLLWGARVGAYGNKPILGVNLGTLGFMVNTSIQELYPQLEKVLQGNYHMEERILLCAELYHSRVSIEKNEAPYWTHYALNDAVISRETLARMLHLRIYINKESVTEYRADGLIISTPTGSTAHSLSAGGPIVYPTLDALIITPICPHTMSNRPLLINGSDLIEVEVLSPNKNTHLTLDGQEGIRINNHDIIHIQKAKDTVHLVTNPSRTYFQVLHTKLHWGGN